MANIHFSPQSMEVLNKMDRLEQMKVIERFSHLSRSELDTSTTDLGKFSRDGKVLYRLRSGDHRIYFEHNDKEKSFFAHYIVHQHTLTDFVLRFKLPVSESFLLEEHPSFWQYLESFK
jgi:mRNA-degrading endonuclease RelE of RelBE toxin-antitoxin system